MKHKPIRHSLTKKKCQRCKEMKLRTSFKMLSNFNPSIFLTSRWCRICERKHDKFIQDTNRLIRLTQTIMRGGQTQTMIGFRGTR